MRERRSYDAAERLTDIVAERGGQPVSYSYDASSRLTEMRGPGANVPSDGQDEVAGRSGAPTSTVVIRAWGAAFMVTPFIVGGAALVGVILVGEGVLGVGAAALLCGAYAVVHIARSFASKLVIGEAGVEVVNVLRRRRLRWSEIEGIRVAEDAENSYDDSTLEFLVGTSSSDRPRTVRAAAAAVGGSKWKLLVRTLNAHAAVHRIPSSLSEARVFGRPRSE